MLFNDISETAFMRQFMSDVKGKVLPKINILPSFTLMSLQTYMSFFVMLNIKEDILISLKMRTGELSINKWEKSNCRFLSEKVTQIFACKLKSKALLY